ncbi:MAG: DUF1905 domain-containing protein [Spirochaetales bacterium]|nr:DUF1905 domain-containing protein [Spirochaetales bacterium]
MIKNETTGKRRNIPTIRFKAVLYTPDATGKNGSWSFLSLPKNESKHFSSQGPTMVEGILNSFPFRTALEPDGKGGHRLKVSKALCDAADLVDHDTASVEMTRVGDEPKIRVPEDLEKALEASPPAREAWSDITPMARRDWVLWITTARQSETRSNRIEKACDMLASGKRRVCCFPGLNWMTKDHVTPEETWSTLPK